MTPVSEAIGNIRTVLKRVGAAEFARLSDVPYTTLREWEAQDFQARSVVTLDKLSAAAESYLAGHDDEGAPHREAAA